MNYCPIILIGAARSGTKMLRDIIGSHPDFATIPFDINFVWKYNNEHILHDALTIRDVNNKSAVFIRKYFAETAKENPFLIEKTVSNSLRIDFVKAIFPNAKFIYLTRDGRDVVESVARQWGQAPDNNYLIQKVKSFPLLKTLSYGFGYGMDLLRIHLLGKPSASYVWGVKYPSYQEDLKQENILTFCAKQWKECVEYSEEQIQNISSDKLFRIRYEDFVREPVKHLQGLSQFLEISPNFNQEKIASIKPVNIGKGFTNLDAHQQKQVLGVIQSTLDRLHYN